MGLFSSSATTEPEDSTEPKSGEQTTGPYDSREHPELEGLLDFGALRIPNTPGLSIRMDTSPDGESLIGLSIILDGSELQLSAFAAPKTTGIWEEIRSELTGALTAQGATIEQAKGPFGPELRAKASVVSASGSRGTSSLRFVGVDGPRWFLRAVFNGPAANGGQPAADLEAVLTQVVVHRDNAPRPPREVLSLHLPGEALEAQAALDNLEMDA